MAQNAQVAAWNGESGRAWVTSSSSPGLAAASASSRAAAISAAAEVMAQHVDDGRVVMGAATWVVTGRAG